MLFQVDYKVFQANRADALRAFGSFTQEQLEGLTSEHGIGLIGRCLLYTSDAADE